MENYASAISNLRKVKKKRFSAGGGQVFRFRYANRGFFLALALTQVIPHDHS